MKIAKKSYGLIWLCMSLLALCFILYKLLTAPIIDYNIASIFQASENKNISLAKQRLEEVYSNKVVLAYRASTKEEAQKSAAELVLKAKDYPELLALSPPIHLDDYKEFFSYLYQYRHSLLADEDFSSIQKQQYDKLRQNALKKIYNPISRASHEQLQKDSFFLFDNFITQNLRQGLSAAGENLENFTIIQKGSEFAALVTFELKMPAFSTLTQEKMKDFYGKAVEISQKNQISIYRSGVVFHSAYGSDTIKADIHKISLISVFLILLIFIIFFRSIGPLFTIGLVILNAVSFGFAITLLIFGKIHILAISFAMAVIGLAVDYCFHIFCKKEEGQSHQKAILALKKPLILSFATTAIGYFSYFIMPMDFMRHAAVFSIAGLSATLISCFLWMPFLPMKAPAIPYEPLKFIKQKLHRFKKPVMATSLIGLSLWVGIGMLRLQSNDDVKNLQSLSEDLLYEQNIISSFQSLPSLSAFLLISGEDKEETLQNSEFLHNLLDEQNMQYFSISKILPSLKRQKENYGAIEKAKQSQAYQSLQKQLSVGGDEDNYEFAEILSQHMPPNNPIAAQLKNLELHIDGQYYLLLPIFGEFDHKVFQSLLAPFDFVKYSHLTYDITDFLENYRKIYIKVILISVITIFTALAFIYSPLEALRLILAPVLAVVSAISAFGILNIDLTVFAVMSLTLVLVVAVDYGILIYEKGLQNSTLMSIFLSVLSTLSAFGLLSLSQNFPILSLGISVTFGIISAVTFTIIFSIIYPKKEKHNEL